MDPYRSVSREARAEAPRDPGIVGEIIAQFADPLAFYRELVQNSIDAGTPSIEIKLEHDESAGVLRVAVRDRGEGMTRDVLENQLLVLFRSTKDKDDSKIGKFGIGFTSVLAPSPEVVAVHTSRDGRRLVLHLNPDLTYQLFDGGPATQSGTSVELDLTMRADEVADFARKSIAALERWCRHASVPITITAHVPGEPTPTTARIDRPLALDATLVEVRGQSSDGKLVAVVGLTSRAAPYTGFFNHGLLLHETTEPLLGKIAVKVQDARLGHTLSRDDVRRDANFDRALALARGLVERELPAAAATALRAAAEAGDHAQWWTLVFALEASKLEVPKRGWSFPLVEPNDARRSVMADSLGRSAWASERSSPLTKLLASSGQLVLHSDTKHSGYLRALVSSIAGCTLSDVGELTCVTPLPLTDADEVLIAKLNELFAETHRAPSVIVVAKLEGLYADVLAVSGEPSATEALRSIPVRGDAGPDLRREPATRATEESSGSVSRGPESPRAEGTPSGATEALRSIPRAEGTPEGATSMHALDREQVVKNPFARKRLPLVLNEAHAWYRAARAMDPRAGASLIARVLLLQHALLDVPRSTLIFERAASEIGLDT